MALAIKPISFVFGILWLFFSACPGYATPVIEISSGYHIHIFPTNNSQVSHVHLYPSQNDRMTIRIDVTGKIGSDQRTDLRKVSSNLFPSSSYPNTTLSIQFASIEITLPTYGINSVALADSIDKLVTYFDPKGMGHDTDSNHLLIQAINQIFKVPSLTSIPQERATRSESLPPHEGDYLNETSSSTTQRFD